jgi:hypothetical protein
MQKLKVKSEASVKNEFLQIPYFFINKKYLLIFDFTSWFHKDRGF